MSIAQEDQIFADILEAEKMFVRNREEMLKYEARERYEMDCASLKSDGIEEGKQIGIGCTAYSSQEARPLIGTKDVKPIIHYNYLYLN